MEAGQHAQTLSAKVMLMHQITDLPYLSRLRRLERPPDASVRTTYLATIGISYLINLPLI